MANDVEGTFQPEQELLLTEDERAELEECAKMMPDKKYLRLDDLAAPDGYVAPSTSEDFAYIAYFRQTCKRYNIDFTSADQDERDFVIRMAEKNFAQKRA